MATCLLVLLLFQSSFSLDPESAEVQKWMTFLQEERASQTRDALMRSLHFVPRFKRIFRDEGVPENLVWTAFIESSFRSTPTSPTQAQGMYQFKEDTARAFGLRVDEQIDERDDPVKSATVAAQYMKYLYDKFGDWELVLAAYNLGEGDLRRTMERLDFSTWPQVKPHVREETRNFVGKIKAAALIGNAFLDGKSAHKMDRQLTHVVRKGETLYRISRLYGVTVEELRDHNGLSSNNIRIDQILVIPELK